MHLVIIHCLFPAYLFLSRIASAIYSTCSTPLFLSPYFGHTNVNVFFYSSVSCSLFARLLCHFTYSIWSNLIVWIPKEVWIVSPQPDTNTKASALSLECSWVEQQRYWYQCASWEETLPYKALGMVAQVNFFFFPFCKTSQSLYSAPPLGILLGLFCGLFLVCCSTSVKKIPCMSDVQVLNGLKMSHSTWVMSLACLGHSWKCWAWFSTCIRPTEFWEGQIKVPHHITLRYCYLISLLNVLRNWQYYIYLLAAGLILD